MATVTVTAAQVGLSYPYDARTRSRVALAAIARGESYYIDPTTGKAGLCDANDAGKEQFAGIALEPAAAGQTFSGNEGGEMTGFDLSAVNFGGFVYQGDTPGALADVASATKTIRVGRVEPIFNGLTATKVLRIFPNVNTNW